MSKKTVIQGNDNNQEQQQNVEKQVSASENSLNKKKTSVVGVEKPMPDNRAGITTDLGGFLVSYSNGGKPEYWLLQYGANRIGSDENNDIQLKESSVSSNHARLIIRRNQTSGDLMFTLMDIGSGNGIFVNDIDIAYDTHKCENGDVIQIGGYKLLLLAFDKDKSGLGVNENFNGTEASNYPPIREKSTYASRDYYNPDDGKTRIQNK